MNIVLGDSNAKFGEDREEGIVGSSGLSNRNEKGSRLLELCQGGNMLIANT